MKSPWEIREKPFSVDTARAYEGIFTLGSGYLQIRGSLEEHLDGAPQNRPYDRKPATVTAEEFPDQPAKWGTYVPGLFGPHPLLNDEMINLPWFLDLAPFVGDEKLDMAASRVEGCERVLDMKGAVLGRTLIWKCRSGPQVSVRFERFVSLARPSLCLQRLTLESDGEAVATVRAGIDAEVLTSGFDHFESVEMIRESESGLCCRVRTNGGDDVSMISRLVSTDAAGWSFAKEARRGRLSAKIRLLPGRPCVVEKRTTVATSRDLKRAEPETVLDAAGSSTWDQLLAEHRDLWAARWERSDVVIEGDLPSQQAMRFALFHLLRSHVEHDSRVAIDAKGFSGDAYFGRFFWDTEIYLLPFFLYTDPERARTLVDFRVRTLDGARRNARLSGYGGARYPWESDSEGRECCACWQFADHEVHVTADAVYGLAHHVLATGGEPPAGRAAEMIVETARYWLDRLDRRPGDGHPSLLGVMGPDEYTPIAHNNAFTNRLVAFNLDMAARWGGEGGATLEERKLFAETAAALPLCRSPDGKLVLQCEAFDSFTEPRFDELWKDRSVPLGVQVPQERLYRMKCIKQADVILLMMLFPHEFSDEEVRAAWEYYLPLTTHDSSLSTCVHAVVALRLGERGLARRFWEKSLAVDLDANGGAAGEGIHIAGCGGVWQVAVLGFAGMRTAVQSEVFSLDPKLPDEWTRLAFPVVWRGRRLYIEIDGETCLVIHRGGNDLDVEVSGRREKLPARGRISFPCAAMKSDRKSRSCLGREEGDET